MTLVADKVYICGLEKDTYNTFRELERAGTSIIHIQTLDSALEEAVLDRISFARELIASARQQMGVEEITEHSIFDRNALSRSYYAIHHVIRALLLKKQKYDSPGHRDSILRFEKLFVKGDASLRALIEKHLGDADAVRRRLENILEQRHHADYDVYGKSEISETPTDFSKIAPLVAQDAEAFMGFAEDYLKSEDVSI